MIQKIGVVIPAYNEAVVIRNVLTSLPKTIQYKGKKLSVVPVLVDDASRDDTAAIASSIKDVVLIRHLVNSGAGAATRTGLSYVRELKDYKLAATMDADGQHSPKDLVKIIKSLEKNTSDVVIGSRLINTEGMPWYKIVGNKGLNFVTFLLLGVSTTDSQSGLKAFNRKAIDRLSYRENGYAFCSEMLWRANQANLAITEEPIEAIYTEYSKAKGQSNWNAIQIIKQLIKHRISDLLHG